MSERKEAVLRGYIIANRHWDAQTALEMGASTFASRVGDAWRRHVGHERAASLDFSIYIQRWSDRGYGPLPVEIRPLPHDKEVEG